MTLLVLPGSVTASATLLMIHPTSDESAMTTDLNLLQTRTVASRVLSELDLRESPEALLSTVTVTPVNAQILSLTMSGPDQTSAVARATSLIHHFLEFRAEELRRVSNGLIKGYESQIADRQAQVNAFTREYDRLSTDTNADAIRGSDILAARATLGTQITVLQSSIEEVSLKTSAAITATHVIDAPRARPPGLKRQLVLYAASGALLGAAIAIGVIFFRALTSDGLRQRREVATALGVPVRVGVGPIPSQGFLGRTEAAVFSRVRRRRQHAPSGAGPVKSVPVARVGWRARRRRRNLEALVQGLESALPPRLTNATRSGSNPVAHRRPSNRSATTTLGIVAVDRAETAAVVLREAGDRLAKRGARVLVVDLSSAGALAAGAGLSEPTNADWAEPRIYRPEGDPALCYGPRRSRRNHEQETGRLGELDAAWDEADVVLVLVEVDPGINLDIVRTWVNRVVPLVTAGRANGELLSTIAGIVADAGLEMPFALLEGADRSDRTLGQPAPMTEVSDELAAVQPR